MHTASSQLASYTVGALLLRSLSRHIGLGALTPDVHCVCPPRLLPAVPRARVRDTARYTLALAGAAHHPDVQFLSQIRSNDYACTKFLYEWNAWMVRDAMV